MKEFNLDEVKGLSDSIVIILDGKKLTIRDRTAKEWDEITQVVNAIDQLALWADIDVKELEGISMTKISAAIGIIARTILEAQKNEVPSKIHQPKTIIPNSKK